MIQFLVHHRNDTVGVAVVDIRAGRRVTGKYLDGGQAVEVEARADIALGHKIALGDHAVADTVFKYGHDVGGVVADIRTGDHVHVHNLKTKRW